ncbi:MAG: hypothetical protein ACOX8U_09115, partial [Bradymonadia bacterium]
ALSSYDSLQNVSFCLKLYRICKIKFTISSRAKVSLFSRTGLKMGKKSIFFSLKLEVVQTDRLLASLA